MKEKKKITKEPSGSVKVDPGVLMEVATYCKERGIKLTFYVTEAMKEKLKHDKSK